MLSSFYKLCCGILGVTFFRRHNFPSFPVRILPEGPRRLLAEDPDRIMHLDVFLFFWLLSLRPFPSIGCAAIPVRSLVLFCASHPLSRVLRGSPYGKQGLKSAADLRKVAFLPSSAQACGQKPKRISHRYRQLRAK